MENPDQLTYSDIVKIARLEAEPRRISIETAERDETLFVEARHLRPPDEGTSRRKATFWTAGTGAFIVDFDNQWTWNVTAYSYDDQTDAVRQILKVVHCYLLGEGRRQERKKSWRRIEKVLVIDLGDEEVALQAKKEIRRESGP